MENFEKLLQTMYNYFLQENASGSVLQVTVRNYDQLCILCSEDEIKEIDYFVNKVMHETLSEFCKFRIFEYNKFYYIITNLVTKEDVSKISYLIHDNLVSKFTDHQFVDARIMAAKIKDDIKFLKLVRILADHIHYSDISKIFEWIYDPEEYTQTLNNNYSHLRELRDCIETNTACFAFQPVITCKTGEIAYHECLLRLSNEDYKLISAGPYIMLAEKYGLIRTVDKYVFEMAIQELNNTKDVSLSVNISNVGVQDNNLLEYIKNIISSFKEPHRLIWEVTETAINENFNQTKKFIESLKSYGCFIALDDFGSGYTSFRQIKNLPVDILKIDGSFIRDIDTNKKNKTLVETLIKIAEDIGCKTVAEYVENGAIAKKLIELNVDYMQGNFFSPAKNYRSWLKS